MTNHIVLLLFTLFVLSSSRFASDVPLAIWSGESYLTGQNIGISVPLVFSDMESTFQLLFSRGSGTLKNYFSPTMNPEVVVLFLDQELRSEQLSIHASSFPNLKKLLKMEKSSLFAPFVDLEFSLDNTVLNLIKSTISNSGEVIYVRGGPVSPIVERNDITFTDLDSFEELTSNSQIFTNSKTDLIIVHISSDASQDKFKQTDLVINLVNTIISSSTTEYVALYTAFSYADPHLKMDFSSSYLKRSLNQNSNSSAPSIAPLPSPIPANYSGNNTNQTIPIFRFYFGGWFWELVIVSTILLPLLVISIYSIDGIQTPLFESKKKVK